MHGNIHTSMYIAMHSAIFFTTDDELAISAEIWKKKKKKKKKERICRSQNGPSHQKACLIARVICLLPEQPLHISSVYISPFWNSE